MKNKINVKKLKSSLKIKDYKKIVKSLGIPIFSENDKEIVYYTGDHNKDPLKGSPKLVFYKDNKIFVSYTGNATYDIIGLVQKRLKLLGQKCSFLDSLKYIISTIEINIDEVKRIDSPHLCDWQSDYEKFIRFRSSGANLQIYDDSILNQLDHSLPDKWIQEGISAETMKKFNIGFYPTYCQTTIPCFNREGELIGIRVRNWDSERIETGKYMPLMLLDGTIYKFPTNQVFYGINYNWFKIEQTQTVMLVEGEKSVLKADTFFGNDSNVLGLYGSQIGISRRNQLVKMGVKKVILALDSDFHKADDSDKEFVAFKNKMYKLAELFKGFCSVEIVYNNIGLETEGYKASPFDFNFDIYNKLFENREIIY